MSYRTVSFQGSEAEVRERWTAARRNGVGGSDVAAIMGLSKWRSAYTVWCDKTGRIEAEDISDRPAVEWGNRLEGVIRRKFAENHPELVVSEPHEMYVSAERPWAFANLDGVASGDGKRYVLEIKTAGHRAEPDWADGVPLYYLTQVTHYMAVMGFDGAFVAVLIGGQDYREYFVPRDEDDVRAVCETVDAFWAMHVEADVPPAIVGTADEADAIREQHPEQGGEMLEYDEAELASNGCDLGRLDQIKEQIKELEAERKAIENRLKLTIGDAKGLHTEEHRITWSRGKASRLDGKRLKAERPEIYEEYTTEADRDGGLRISVRS